jgi:hypothetical protein
MRAASERARVSEPRERSGDSGVAACERVGGFAGAKPPELKEEFYMTSISPAVAPQESRS